MDEYIRASIREAEGKCDPDTGWYKKLVINGVESREEAELVKRNVHNAGLWLTRNTDLNVTGKAWVKKRADGSYYVEMVAINKEHAYAYMIRTYGEDQSKWPYSTNRFHPNYGA